MVAIAAAAGAAVTFSVAIGTAVGAGVVHRARRG